MLSINFKAVSKARCVLLVVGLMFFAGCVEEKSEYTLNPDGSGKVVYDVIFVPTQLNLSDNETSPQYRIKLETEKILQKSEGIDAWKDISHELTDEGRIHFVGTAYFRDINKVNIRAGGLNKDMRLRFSRSQSGRITIELRKESDSKSSEKKGDVPEFTEAELTQKIKEARLQYNEARPMMLGMLGTLKQVKKLHLPGKIEKRSNFELIDSSTVQVKIEGRKMIEAMDKMMADDEWMKRQIRAGKNPVKEGPDEPVLNEMLFGEKGPVQIILDGDSKALFDYEAEVAQAQKGYKAMIKKLAFGETSPIAVPTITEAKPGKARIGGVRLVTGAEKERGIKPLYQSNNSYTLSVVLELPEPNLITIEGQVEEALTDTGKSILGEHNRRIAFPKLSEDGRAAVFDVKLDVPEEKAKGLSELSGVIECFKATGTKKIDLGVMDFKEGISSDVPGFSIRSVKERYDTKGQEISLRVDLLRNSVKDVKFYREDGTEIDVSSGGSSSSQGRLLGTSFKTKGEFPPRGRIVFEVLDGITKHRIPFKLTNISLLGRPL
ncbi:MAG: hypothetical protein KAY65_07040 [Planctomycetes bacterium]|nr:hypothetical protein [Planctomycetota bacterium]